MWVDKGGVELFVLGFIFRLEVFLALCCIPALGKEKGR